MRHVFAAAGALLLAASPAFAEGGQPVRLTSDELDQVTAGQGLLDLYASIDAAISGSSVTLDVHNVPVNGAIALQANLFGNATQSAQVSAIQQVNQVPVR
jgi:hypothetical protein